MKFMLKNSTLKERAILDYNGITYQTYDYSPFPLKDIYIDTEITTEIISKLIHREPNMILEKEVTI